MVGKCVDLDADESAQLHCNDDSMLPESQRTLPGEQGQHQHHDTSMLTESQQGLDSELTETVHPDDMLSQHPETQNPDGTDGVHPGGVQVCREGMLTEAEMFDCDERWDEGVPNLQSRLKRQLSVVEMFDTEENWDEGICFLLLDIIQ